MAKLNCPCGWQLSNITQPNEIEGIILSSLDLDKLPDDWPIAYEQIVELGRDVWECFKCGRLAVSYPQKGDATVKWYMPEDLKPGKLMEGK